uniref:Uncharacterized protein n=1 Tax=Globisporangium ultimum (strain ATCC 200006 / CBS 805.95 / DAOM BR144) TaxID=431595 RepID=K3WNY2_GLOUD
MTDYLSYEISSALQDNESAASDGIRLLTSFHRLVDNLLLVKLVKRETTGGLLNSKSLFNMEKALNSLMECVRSRDRASVEILIDAVKQKMCVKRLQNVFREHLARDQGAPLVMRPLLHQQYGRINSDYRSRHATRPVQWLHHVISAILRKTMQSEHISSLLLQLSATTTAFTSVSSMENSSSSALNGGIGPAPKPILMELIYDFFLEKFGARWEAEKLIHDLFVNCRLHKSNSMVMLFSALCCMTNASPDDRLLGQNEALAFLHGIFRCGLHNFRVINPQAFVLNVKGGESGASESENIDTELQDWLPIDVAENILITAFSKISVDQKQRLQVHIGEAAAASHPTDMEKSLQSNKTQMIEAGAFLVLALLEWKRYIVQKLNEVKLVCCTLEDEMHQFEKLSQIDTIASVLKKSSVSYTNDDLCFVFRRYCMTEQRYADRKGDTTVQSKNQELVSDRLAAACFPLLSREPLNELLSIENSAVEPFKLAPNPNQSYGFLVSSWSGYREQCHQLLDELRRVEKNNDIQAESFSRRTPAVNSDSRAPNREVLYLSSSTSSDRLSSQDVAQHEAVYLLFNERLERLAELFEKDRITINAGGSRRSSVNVNNDESNSLVDEMHSRVVMVNETWKIFRQVLLGFIKLRSFASLGKGTLPDKWSQLQ